MTTHTHQAAQPAAYVAPEKPKARKRDTRSPGSCKRKCSGGYACVCTSHPHTIHCCSHLDCECRWDLRHSGSGISGKGVAE